MYKIYFSQKLPILQSDAWEFFSNPANLQLITPESMKFKIVHHHENKKMYAGQMISYTVCPLFAIPIQWVSEITVVEKPHYFIDEQRIGPYSLWHHEHWFTAIKGGVLMEDIVYYKMPFGFFGKALHALKVEKDLQNIFSYRKEKLESLFGKL